MRLVDNNGTTVGPYISLPTTYGSAGFIDSRGYLWRIDLETGDLSPFQSVNNTILYTSANCNGTGYLQLGSNGASQRTALMRATFGESGSVRVRTGSIIDALPANVWSYSYEGSCTTYPSSQLYSYGPFITVNNAPLISTPSKNWSGPLHMEL